MENVVYVIMQMKFNKDCDFKNSSDCGIEKDSPFYKPKYIGEIIPLDIDYEELCNFIICMNKNQEDEKYDIVYYLVPGEKMHNPATKEFLDRKIQEEYMSEFFNNIGYIKALKSKKALESCKNIKDLDNCIHTKFCHLESGDYNMLGFPCLDFDSYLDNLKENTDKEDLEKLRPKLDDLKTIMDDINSFLMKSNLK